MVRYAGLPWDAILGTELAGRYMPRPEAYLAAARLLNLSPERRMMVAAHNDDLDVAGVLEFHIAFIAWPSEFGPDQCSDLAPTGDWD